VSLIALIGVILVATGVLPVAQQPPLPSSSALTTSGTQMPTGSLLPVTPIALERAQHGQVILAEERKGQWQLYVRDAGGQETRLLTTLPDFASLGGPVWSPDGQRILFAADSGNGMNDLYTIGVADGALTPVLVSSEVNLVDPSWSPDGEWIAMHANCSLWIARVDGSGVTDLHAPHEFERCVNFPAWSPDGERIVFTEQPWEMGAGPRLVRAIDRNGGGLVTLAAVEEKLFGPARVAWSPDGRQVAYAGSADAGEQWYVVAVDGDGQSQPVTEMPAAWFADFWPQWAE
jgi:Tol biopolymer transport system component